MTPTLPRPIEPGEIRVGDRVRLTWDEPGSVHTHEFTVTFADNIDGLRSIGYRPYTGYTTEYVGTWELLSRPTPAPAVGSRWLRDDGTQYVYTQQDRYVPYEWTTSYDPAPLYPDNASAGTLTPIPDHGDGCSPWLWDPADGVRYVCADDGSYIGISGSEIGWRLRTRHRDQAKVIERLRPWSERGQANG